MAAPFPLRTQQFEASIDGTQTAFLLTAYTDRILVVATQLGTLGTMLHARCAQPLPSAPFCPELPADSGMLAFTGYVQLLSCATCSSPRGQAGSLCFRAGLVATGGAAAAGQKRRWTGLPATAWTRCWAGGLSRRWTWRRAAWRRSSARPAAAGMDWGLRREDLGCRARVQGRSQLCTLHTLAYEGRRTLTQRHRGEQTPRRECAAMPVEPAPEPNAACARAYAFMQGWSPTALLCSQAAAALPRTAKSQLDGCAAAGGCRAGAPGMVRRALRASPKSLRPGFLNTNKRSCSAGWMLYLRSQCGGACSCVRPD